MYTFFVSSWPLGSRCSPSGNEQHKKKRTHFDSDSSTQELECCNKRHSFCLYTYLSSEKKKGRKETKKTRWFTKIFLRWKCVIITAWHFRACENSSKIGRLGNAQVRNTRRVYELSYFCYCLLLPQSSSPNNNNFPSVLMAHCFVKEREASFLLNPFTAKCGQRQVSTKFPNFIFQNCEKQIASCESTGRELSFEWSHHRISSADSKVRLALQTLHQTALWQWRG